MYPDDMIILPNVLVFLKRIVNRWNYETDYADFFGPGVLKNALMLVHIFCLFCFDVLLFFIPV